MAIFVDRVAELPRLLDELQYHPDGLPIADLAAQVGRTPAQVREILLTYYATDFAGYAPDLMWRAVPIEFVGTHSDEEDPHQASIVRLVEEAPGRQLGVAYVPLTELARMYRIGRDRLDLEPDNEILRSAVDKLREGLLPGVMPSSAETWGPPHAFETARAEQRKITISYARAWHPGVVTRVVEPYRLVRTRRGWELDAGPVQANGRLRTYLLNRVQSFEVLAETFEPPHDITDLLRGQRVPTVVELEVPHEAHWAVEKQAESVEVISEDETSVRLRASLLEPVRQRVGLILIDAGPSARVVESAELADAGRELAQTLLDHHLGASRSS
jgi:proteasome accessory factor C